MEEKKSLDTFERLREEITIVRIEGTLFCYDPAEARRRRGIIANMLRDSDGTERPVSVHIHPDFGQPTILAYKIVQAIFLKMTQAGEPHPNVVSFSQRELARLVGRTWSGITSRQLYQAMMQLQNTRIICSIHNKETKEYLEVSFAFLSATMFSNKNKSIHECAVQVHDVIVTSLNRHHAIWLNYQKLRTLDTIGMVLYKRLFFHFSNTYTHNTARSTFTFEKDYEDICCEWLGGLKPEKYKSRIEKQLGRYLKSVQATGLIWRYEICERVNGKGFKIIFWPGDGFYADYAEFYLRVPKPTNQVKQLPTADQHPLQLVAYFHQLLGHTHNSYTEKERAQAAELIKRYGSKEAQVFIEHAVEQAKKDSYPMKFFGAALGYQDRWAAIRERVNCTLCQGQGVIAATDEQGRTVMRACSHGQVLSDGSQGAVQ